MRPWYRVVNPRADWNVCAMGEQPLGPPTTTTSVWHTLETSFLGIGTTLVVIALVVVLIGEEASDKDDTRSARGSDIAITGTTVELDHKDIAEEGEIKNDARHCVLSPLPRILRVVPQETVLSILLVGEGRAGTSLTLDLISSSLTKSNSIAASFSVFEPLHQFFKDTIHRNLSTFPGGIASLFDCSFVKHAKMPHVISSWARIQDSTLNNHRDCFFRPRTMIDSRQKFTTALHHACIGAKARVMKVVRFRGPMFDDFVQNKQLLDTIKVVHIVRHPEPLVQSRIHMGFRGSEDGGRLTHDEYLGSMCERSMQKYHFFKANLRHDQLFVFRYEDLITNPDVVWRRLFRFLDLSLNNETTETLHDLLKRKHQGPKTKPAESFTQKNFSRSNPNSDVRLVNVFRTQQNGSYARGKCDKFFHVFNYTAWPLNS
eukprot:m.136819 g.136819  ORF g.136819 m.136819 type:complete len:430 (-) comp29883_c0_seq1:166-1455(-)